MGVRRTALAGLGGVMCVVAPLGYVVSSCHGGAPGHALPDDAGPVSGCDGAPDCDGGAALIHCDLSAKLGRSLTLPDGGSLVPAPEGFAISDGSQNSVIGVVQNNSPLPSFAFDFRVDRPADAPDVVTIHDSIKNATRSLDNTGTYAIAERFDVDAGHTMLDLYQWSDATGVRQSMVTTWSAPFVTFQPGPANLLSAPQGILYEFAAGTSGGVGQTYLTPAGRAVDLSNPISDIEDDRISEGGLYLLSDGSVMVMVNTSTGGDAAARELHQLHLASADSPAQGPDSRVFPVAAPIHVGSFSRDGASSTDVLFVVEDVASGTYALYGGVLPESQLFTFDLTSLKRLAAPPITAASSTCFKVHEGALTALVPTDAGLDLYVYDLTTGLVTYSATGAANLLHADTNILACAMSLPLVTGSTSMFQVLWVDRTDGGQALSYAPLTCGPL
jgi:hypothetical protein